jgi:hypothetical protein
MGIKFRYVTPLLAAAAAAAAITVAPSATATNPSACMNTERSTLCQKSGHAEISTIDPGAPRSSIYGPFIPPYFPWR